MCNRYSASQHEAIRELARRYAGLEEPLEDWVPSYNIPPKSKVPVVIKSPKQPARLMQWGTDAPMGFLFNARSETISSKSMWKEAAAHRRCLMFADGFFEFETVGKRKVGHYFSLPGGAVFALASIWLPATDDQPDRCLMVTNTPNALVAPFHDRMPTILTAQAAQEWLGDEPLAPEAITRLCQMYPADQMNHWQAPPEMNRPTFQELAALRPALKEPDLFG